MRNIKELLTVMLENERLFNHGLCTWVSNLQIYGYITSGEYGVLHKYVKNNVPFLVKLKLGYHMSGFWWKSDNIKPRIKWIKKHIKKNN